MSDNLRHAWAALDKLFKAVDRLERRVAQLERERAPEPEVARVPSGKAAQRIGCHPRTIRRLIQQGVLKGERRQLPGRERGQWVVELASLERFEAGSGPTAAPAATDGRVSCAGETEK